MVQRTPEDMEPPPGRQSDSGSKPNTERPARGYGLMPTLRNISKIPTSFLPDFAHSSPSEDTSADFRDTSANEIKLLRSRIEQLEQQISATKMNYQQEIDLRDRKISKLQGQAEEDDNYIENMHEEFEDHKASLVEEYNKKITTRDDRIGQMNHDIDRLRRDVSMLQENSDKLQGQIRIAQEGAFRSLKEASWAPKEDGLVRDEFSKLQEKLKSWVKTHAAANLNTLAFVPSSVKESIINQLAGCITQENWDTLIARMTPSIKKRVPTLVSHALVAKHLFETIFSNAFFAFREYSNSPLSFSGSAMLEMYQAMVRAAPTEAHIWRSQMLRLLTMPSPCATKEPILSPRCIEKACTGLADSFLSGPVRSLFKQDEQGIISVKCKQELYKIYQHAGQLSVSLWCQRTVLEVQFLPRPPNQARFTRDNPMITAHRLHHLDEDDERLDNKEVIMITQPALVAYGNEHAENYEMTKVWSPAIVLVDEGTPNASSK